MPTASGYKDVKENAIPIDSKRYRSKFEEKVAAYLEQRGIGEETYESCKISYTVPETVRNYIPDWKLPNGTYLEAKGRFLPMDRKKILLVKADNPGIVLRILFMNADVKLRKGSPTSYGSWCTKNGIEWWDFRKGIPKHWLKDCN